VSLSLFQKGGKLIDGCRRVVFNLVGCPGFPYVQRTDYATIAHRPPETPSLKNVFPDGDNSYMIGRPVSDQSTLYAGFMENRAKLLGSFVRCE
jgi:hypothetical protein